MTALLLRLRLRRYPQAGRPAGSRGGLGYLELDGISRAVGGNHPPGASATYSLTRVGRDAADFQVHRGSDGVRSIIDEMLSPFEGARFAMREYFDAGDDVVAILELLLRLKGSSSEISTGRFAYVYTLREGKITRIQDFPDPAEALEAAGVSR